MNKILRSNWGWMRSLFASFLISKVASSSNNIKLHLGCGGNFLNEWINTDYYPWSRHAYHLNLKKKFPLPDNKVNFIFCEHVLEHFTLEEGLYICSESYRVLKNGGVFRLSIPHLGFINRLIDDKESDYVNEYIDYAYTRFGEDKFENKLKRDVVINNYFYLWGHKFIYSKEGIEGLLGKVGFHDIKEVEVGCSNHNDLNSIDNVRRMPNDYVNFESTVYECRK